MSGEPQSSDAPPAPWQSDSEQSAEQLLLGALFAGEPFRACRRTGLRRPAAKQRLRYLSDASGTDVETGLALRSATTFGVVG